MGWIGKIIGGTLGFAIGGPLGAIAGAAFGHAFDRSTELPYPEEAPRRPLPSEQAQLTFFVAVFSMLAKLAKADGDITQSEIEAVNRFMVENLNLDPRSRMVAMSIFNTALNSASSFEDFAGQFAGQFHAQPQILEMMVDILLRVAVADGRMSPNEERLILAAVRMFNFGDAAYATLKSRYVQTSEKDYAILGARPDDPDDEIKRRYRKLVMEYHPDRILSKGLPEEFTKFAQDKFREIQEAYDSIRKERGIK
jgi:DnaJ like chaperone protein